MATDRGAQGRASAFLPLEAPLRRRDRTARSIAEVRRCGADSSSRWVQTGAEEQQRCKRQVQQEGQNGLADCGGGVRRRAAGGFSRALTALARRWCALLALGRGPVGLPGFARVRETSSREFARVCESSRGFARVREGYTDGFTTDIRRIRGLTQIRERIHSGFTRVLTQCSQFTAVNPSMAFDR